MKNRLLPIIFAAAIGLAANANAARVYYLVGLRHVYSVPAVPDPHEMDRQAIEEDYSAAVQQAQKQFDTDMASIHDEESKDGGNVHQVDRDAVQQNLEQAIGEAADKREANLAAIYPQVDYVRASHPQFAVDQDGPYHVIGVETAPTGEYVDVIYYRPYPLYVDICPFGWYWGRPYPFATFGIQVGLFHSTWLSIGCPVFAPMFYGGVSFVVNAPIRQSVIMGSAGWVGGRPPAITAAERRVLQQNRAAQSKAGLLKPRPGSRLNPTGGASKYSRTGPAGNGSRTNPGGAATGASKYGHSASSNSGSTTGTSKYSRSGSSTSGTGSTTGTSRYGRTGSSTSGTGSSAGTSKYVHTGSSTTGSSSSSKSSGSGSHGAGSSSSDKDKKKSGG